MHLGNKRLIGTECSPWCIAPAHLAHHRLSSWPQVFFEKPRHCFDHVLAAPPLATVTLLGQYDQVEFLVCLDKSVNHLHRVGE